MRGNAALRVDEGVPLVDHLVIANTNRTDLGNAVAVRPSTCRFNIDDDVVLFGIEREIDTRDMCGNAHIGELAETGELIAPDHIAFGLYFSEGDGALMLDHEIGETVAHGAVIVTHEPQDGRDSRRACARQQSAECLHIEMLPRKDAVWSAPLGSNGTQDQRKDRVRHDSGKLLVNFGSEQAGKTVVLKTMWHPVKAAM